MTDNPGTAPPSKDFLRKLGELSAAQIAYLAAPFIADKERDGVRRDRAVAALSDDERRMVGVFATSLGRVVTRWA